MNANNRINIKIRNTCHEISGNFLSVQKCYNFPAETKIQVVSRELRFRNYIVKEISRASCTTQSYTKTVVREDPRLDFFIFENVLIKISPQSSYKNLNLLFFKIANLKGPKY